MKKITLQFENEYYGKFDTIKKEIDCEFQAGNASASPQLQIVNIQRSLCLSIYDFVEKIGLDPEVFKDHLNVMYDEYSGETEDIPENNFEVDKSDFYDLADDIDYDSFVKQFNESDTFKQTLFSIFQEYMNDE